MSLLRHFQRPGGKKLRRGQYWFLAWLALGAGLSALLIFDSVNTYLFVSKKLAVEQSRREMNRIAATFEHEVQRVGLEDRRTIAPLLERLLSGPDKPLWMELRTQDGVVASAGLSLRASFPERQIRRGFRNREPVFTTLPTPVGEAVAEIFAMHVRPPHRPRAGPPNGAAAFPIFEIAAPLEEADTVLTPIRRNLAIECSAAIALLISVLIAALRRPAYLRARQVEQQVELARRVQQTLLPSGDTVFSGLELAGECVPAGEVGGDFYDTFPYETLATERRGVALVLADVSGKGLPAALLAALIHGAVRLGDWTESAARHEGATGQLNRLLFERASGERYATMFWCYFDSAGRGLRYINAGHCPPLLARRRGGEVEVERLTVGGPVVGLLPAAQFEQGSVAVAPGDVLVVFSDGIVEASGEGEEEFGEERLAEILRRNHAAGAEEIRRLILSAVRTFIGGAPLRDDLTFVVASFGAAAASERRARAQVESRASA